MHVCPRFAPTFCDGVFVALPHLAVQVLGKGLKDLPRDKIVVATKVSIAAVASKATPSHTPGLPAAAHILAALLGQH